MIVLLCLAIQLAMMIMRKTGAQPEREKASIRAFRRYQCAENLSMVGMRIYLGILAVSRVWQSSCRPGITCILGKACKTTILKAQ